MEQRLLDDWLTHLKAGGKSAGTMAGYAWKVRRLQLAYPALAALAFGAREIEQQLALDSGDATRKHTLAALKSFFGYVCGRAGAPSPVAALKYPRKVRPVRKTRALTAEQAGRLLASFDTSTLAGLRNLALVALLLDTGLRAAEVCRLQVSDLDLPSRRLEVTAKGGEFRRAKYSEPAAGYLEWWLEARARWRLLAPREGAVFVSMNGSKQGQGLTPDGLRAVFRAMGARAGLGALAPHDLRRTFVTIALRLGAPTRLVQIAGGWQSIHQLEAYSRDLGLDDFVELYAPAGRLLAR